MSRCVLVIRHAKAEELEAARLAGRDEHQRQLTDAGRRKMREGARGLRNLVDGIDLIACSPLTRALQTAELVSGAFPDAKRSQYSGLAPGVHHSELLRWINRQKGSVAIVGHEPDLSQWIGYMATGEPRGVVVMKKGAVCCLEMPKPAVAGEARIAWHMTLRQLTELA
ncbi:MAG TPA: histidine phosphatase family protein [Gammaproteobacteria bacterium]|jgi:phosphohistidine phosphatase